MRSLNEWIGIEGVRQGHPILWRVRKLDLNKIRRDRTPWLFVLSWLYEPNDASLLPEDSFYARLKAFEPTIDEIERSYDSIFVATETGEGRSHYFFYTSRVEALADFLNSKIPQQDHVEYSSKRDSKWNEYRRILGPATSE